MKINVNFSTLLGDFNYDFDLFWFMATDLKYCNFNDPIDFLVIVSNVTYEDVKALLSNLKTTQIKMFKQSNSNLFI